jgi:hypothetical protein
MSESDRIRGWRERAEQICLSGYDLEKGAELAKEIHRFGLSPLQWAAGSFLGQLEGKMDDHKLAIARNGFYGLFRILQEEEARDTNI